MKNRQLTETVNLASTSEIETINIGRSIASTLYSQNTTIWLSGGLGAGKTTLVKGLGCGLELGDIITSPTFALENRYGDKLLHVDLYRLDKNEAQRIIEENSEFPGIRVIEWSGRINVENGIQISLKELSQTGREIEIIFADMPLPSRQQIEKWRAEIRLPVHISEHCDAVGDFAEKCGYEALNRGFASRPLALRRAGEMHDILKIMDITGKTRGQPPPKEITDMHAASHEKACACFLRDRGYRELASIVETHGLGILDVPGALKTTEQKILFYADKRVLGGRIVTLNERFDDFVERYGNGKESEQAKQWRKKTKQLEKDMSLCGIMSGGANAHRNAAGPPRAP